MVYHLPMSGETDVDNQEKEIFLNFIFNQREELAILEKKHTIIEIGIVKPG